MSGRVLAAVAAPSPSLADHRAIHPPPRHGGRELVEELRRARIRGRGGGGFPLAAKLDAVRARRRGTALVINACEGEPLSAKDRVLVTRTPHLVLDGAAALARAAGATEVLLAVDRDAQRSVRALEAALRERSERALRDARVLAVAPGYVSGQETALTRWATDGDPRPRTAPPRVTERGVRGRPTLVANAETVAHAALVAAHGADWYARCGTPAEPGTTLVTLAGAVTRPGVHEIEYGTPLAELLDGGGRAGELAGVLVGGYGGSWITAAAARRVALSDAGLGEVGARLGAGIVVALGQDACAVAELARVGRWMSDQGAGQCGPCTQGLHAIAIGLEDLRDGVAGAGALDDLRRWCRLVTGRGACAHPDGLARFVASALTVFAEALADHADQGPCDACAAPGQLPVPELALTR